MPRHVTPRHVELFADIFSGRVDVTGTWEGGCSHTKVTTATYKRHLTEPGSGIGIYPLLNDGKVRWGCVDIDSQDNEHTAHAINVVTALTELGCRPHLERTVKGWHVWLFTPTWTPAPAVRAALTVACQIVDYTPREINPKQTSLEPGKVGNYVRLPYHVDAAIGERWMHTTRGEPIPFHQWIATVETRAAYTDPQAVTEAADLWIPPPPPVVYTRPAELIGWNPTGLIKRVTGASQGSRNNILYWASKRVAEAADNGAITGGEAAATLSALVEAAVAAGLPRKEAERTARSAAPDHTG